MQELYRKVSAIDLETLKREAVNENREELVDINSEKQMYQTGVDSRGNPIRPEYHPITVRIKKAKGQPYNRVTLRDTEDFHKSMLLKVKGDEYQIDATDHKTRDLVSKYGDIFGIAPQFLPEAREKVTRSLGRLFKRATGL